MKSQCRPLLLTITMLITVATVLMMVGPTSADPMTDANIFLYPAPQAMSDLVFANGQGKSVSLKDYRGRVLLLHFWSINCPACRMEEPLLLDLKKTFASSGLEILGVNLTDKPEQAVWYAAAKKFPFPVLLGQPSGAHLRSVKMGERQTAFLINGKQEAVLEVPGLPTTYVIDCRGSAVAQSVGVAGWNEQAARGLIKRLTTQAKSCKSADGPRKYSDARTR